jgi:hypothetical protein
MVVGSELLLGFTSWYSSILSEVLSSSLKQKRENC